MNDLRQDNINEIQKIVKKYANFTDQKKLAAFSDQIFDAAIECMQIIKPGFSGDDFEKLMIRLTTNCDTYIRKVLSGMTLAFLLGTYKFPQDNAGSLTGIFINMVYGEYDSDEKSSIVNMMRDMYVVAQRKSPFN